jgi:hypothetical protein
MRTSVLHLQFYAVAPKRLLLHLFIFEQSDLSNFFHKERNITFLNYFFLIGLCVSGYVALIL